jgi:ribosomal protein L37E
MSRGKHSHSRKHRAQEPASGGRLSMSLAFTAARCTRCGEKRPATQRCATCGEPARPGEYDVKAQRRRNASAAVRDRLDRPAEHSAAPATGLGPLLGGLAGMPGRLLEAMQELDQGGQAEQRGLADMLAVVDELRTAQAQLVAPWPRPWRRYARQAGSAVDSLRGAVEHLVAAFAANDVGPAQQEMAQAETLLDYVGECAGSLGEELEFASSVLDLQVGDFLSACMARELARIGGAVGGLDALLALDNAGRGRLPVLADKGSPGIGLQVQAVVLPAAVLLDADALVALCCKAHERLRPERIRALAQDSVWQQAQRAATTALLDGCQRLSALADLPDRPARQHVRDSLLFVQDIVEGPLRHHLATLLACDAAAGAPMPDSYAAARDRNGNRVVETARDRLPAAFTDGAAVAARNSSAHLDFAVDDHGVQLQASQPARTAHLTFDALTDTVLALLETALALQLAVIAAIDAEDLLPDDTDLLDELDPDLLSKLLLTAVGWRNLSLTTEGTLLRITGTSDLPSPLATVGMLLARLDAGITDVELVAHAEGRTKVFRAKTAPFRTWNDRPDPDNEPTSLTLFTNALVAVTIDGNPVVTRETIRHLAAVLVGQRINCGPAEAAERIALIRSWAAAHNDAELDDALKYTHRAVTAMHLQLAPTPVEQAAIARIADWEKTTAPLARTW